MSTEPVTVIITRTVRAGQEEAFEATVRDWIPTALAFPGHLGVHMLRPPPGGREYGAVLTFQSAERWAAFRDSAPYRAFVAKLSEYLEGEPRVTVTGLESWFTPPGSPVSLAPPLWKMAIVTWLGVNIATGVLMATLGPLTAGWPWLLGLVTINAAVVVALTWLIMPLLTRLLRPWLATTGETHDTGRP